MEHQTRPLTHGILEMTCSMKNMDTIEPTESRYISG